MTDKEKAIVMAYTGACTLTGEKFQIFHKYIEDIMGRPIMIHEIGWLENEIKEKSKADFIAICTDESSQENPNLQPEKRTDKRTETHECDLISREETLTAFADYAGSGMSMNDYDALWDIVAKMPQAQPHACDYISRQTAIDVIENEQKKIMRSDWAIDQAKFSAMSEIRELIADLPSAGLKGEK